MKCSSCIAAFCMVLIITPCELNAGWIPGCSGLEEWDYILLADKIFFGEVIDVQTIQQETDEDHIEIVHQKVTFSVFSSYLWKTSSIEEVYFRRYSLLPNLRPINKGDFFLVLTQNRSVFEFPDPIGSTEYFSNILAVMHLCTGSKKDGFGIPFLLTAGLNPLDFSTSYKFNEPSFVGDRLSPYLSYSDWFGAYWDLPGKWICNYQFGWLYVGSRFEEGGWLYSWYFGWLYFDKQQYPYVYSSDWGWIFFYVGEVWGNSILYYFKSNNNEYQFISDPRLPFYDFSPNKVIINPRR